MRRSSTFQYKDLMVGQKWTDGTGIIEIISIRVPGCSVPYGDDEVIVEYQFIPPISYPDIHKSPVSNFKAFIKNFNGRLVPVRSPEQEPDIPNSKNRFEKMDEN